MSEALEAQKEQVAAKKKRFDSALKQPRQDNGGVVSTEPKTVEIRGPRKTVIKRLEITTYKNGVVKSRHAGTNQKR